MVKKVKKQVGGIIPRAGGNLAGATRPLAAGAASPVGAASPLGGGALPGTRMVKRGGRIKAKRGGRVKKK